MAQPTILVTQRLFDADTRAFLQREGFATRVPDLPDTVDRLLSHDELVAMLHGVSGWIVGHAGVTRALLEAAPDVRVVARRGVGYDRVDVEAARELGRVVTITAGSNEGAVADHTLSLMLALLRRLRETQDRLVAGDRALLISSDLAGRTVGLVGLGRIARQVVRRLQGFECRLLVHAPRPDEGFARQHGVSYVDLPTLLRGSDIVSLHAPLTPDTRFLIDRAALALMKPTALLINTARGGLVEDAHLLEALRENRIAGAGLDVFVSEADPAYGPVTAALAGLPNVVATPHVAASSHEGLARMNRFAAEAVVAILKDRPLHPGWIVADGRRGRAAPAT